MQRDVLCRLLKAKVERPNKENNMDLEDRAFAWYERSILAKTPASEELMAQNEFVKACITLILGSCSGLALPEMLNTFVRAVAVDVPTTCPVCNGTKVSYHTSFADPEGPLLERTCHVCRGKGTI